MGHHGFESISNYIIFHSAQVDPLPGSHNPNGYLVTLIWEVKGSLGAVLSRYPTCVQCVYNNVASSTLTLNPIKCIKGVTLNRINRSLFLSCRDKYSVQIACHSVRKDLRQSHRWRTRDLQFSIDPISWPWPGQNDIFLTRIRLLFCCCC